MAILGYRSANMAVIYARISDPELRRQYEKLWWKANRVNQACSYWRRSRESLS
jgi:hypothetical protein